MSAEYLTRLEASIPEEVRELPVWLLWRYKHTKADTKPKKVPFYVDGGVRQGKLDTVGDRGRLVAFPEATGAFSAEYEGLGVALGAVPDRGVRLAGIDFDNVIRDGVTDPRVVQVIESVETYAETSVNGGGVHILGTGKTGVTKTDAVGLEIYDAGRYFTVSGRALTGPILADIVAAAGLARQLFPSQRKAGAPALTEAPIPEHSRNNTLFSYARALRVARVPRPDAWDALQVRNRSCVPAELPDLELKGIFDRGYDRFTGYALTDLGNSERLAATRSSEACFVAERGWLHWAPPIWAPDRGHVMRMAADMVRGIYVEAQESEDERRKALVTWTAKSESRGRLEAAVSLARDCVALQREVGHFDQHPMLFAVTNGVIDLETGSFREGRRDDLLSQKAGVAYDSSAEAPRWREFLREVFGDEERIAYWQRVSGYMLTGTTEEQKWWLISGQGDNGKTTLLNTMRLVLGDYGVVVPAYALGHRPTPASAGSDIARMYMKRLGTCCEFKQKMAVDENLLKSISGNEWLTGKRLYQDSFDFEPRLKLVIATNALPDIRGMEHATWKRIEYVRLEGRITAIDRKLPQKLLAEGAGILNWALAGCAEWRRIGLSTPSAVTEATQEYRDSQNVLKEMFRRELLDFEPGNEALRMKTADLYDRCYTPWVSRFENVRYEDRLSRIQLRQLMQDVFKVPVRKLHGVDHYVGFGRVAPPDDGDGGM